MSGPDPVRRRIHLRKAVSSRPDTVAQQRPIESGAPRSGRRSFNEAAHKLGYWPVGPAPVREHAPSDAIRAAHDDERDVVAHASKAVLGLGALGIVYGDLGTSPLYTVQTIFTAHRDAAHATVAGVYGISSLIFWAMIIIISIKYAGFIMRAHIANLRRKLGGGQSPTDPATDPDAREHAAGARPAAGYIRTDPGVGYRFAA